MNIINEIESKEIRTVQDILQNKKELNYNNLKLYLVKEICSKYYCNYIGNIMEGNLEILSNGNKWLKVSYYIDKRAKIFISLKSPKNLKKIFYMIIPIKDIYKNRIKNNLLTIYISKEVGPLKSNDKKTIFFTSEQREEMCKLDITINFLRVKVNYDKYVYNYGLSRFPLYKTKWYLHKSLLYYASLEENGITIQNINSMNSIVKFKKTNYSYSEPFNIKIFNKSKIVKKAFNFIINSTLSIFFGKIQEKLTLKNKLYEKKEEDIKKSFIKSYNYLYNFSIPIHLKRTINKYLKSSKYEMEQINKEIYRQSKISYKDSQLTLDQYWPIKRESNTNNTNNNIIINNTNSLNNSKANIVNFIEFIRRDIPFFLISI